MKKDNFLKLITLSWLAIPLTLGAQGVSTSLQGTSVTEPAVAPTTPPVSIGGSTLVPTSISLTKNVIPSLSNLRELPLEKRALAESSPLGKTTLFITEELVVSSLRSESLIARVGNFIETEEKKGGDVSLVKAKLDEAKNTLSLANASISELSSSTESFANEISTSTYKKAVRAKRVEFRKNAEDARTNIKKTNKILREIVLTFTAPITTTSSPSTPKTNNSTTGSGTSSQGFAPVPPPPSFPLSTTTKKTLILEQ